MNKFKLLFTCIAAVLWHINASAQPKPNILWVVIEDTSPEFIGAYGNPDARTPNINKLAREGVRFTSAYSTNTVCSPSRTTLITGVRTFETGTGNHRSNFPVPQFMHGFPYYMQQAGYYVTNNAKTDYNVTSPKKFIAQAWNESSNEAGWWNRKPGQPFFAVFNYNDCHQSRTMTDPYDVYMDEVLNKLKPEERIADNAFKMPPIYHDSPEMRKQMARVYNALKYTDNRIGELLARLAKDKLTDSTIIFFYGDHGEGIPRGKTNGINFGYRVPLVIWFPPMYKHLSPWGTGVVSDELIDFEDLPATLISLAGGKVPNHMKGRVFMSNKRKPAPASVELSSDRSDDGIDLVRSITDGHYTYNRNYYAFIPEMRYINYMEVGDIKKQIRKDYADHKLNPLQQSFLEPRTAESFYDVKKDNWETNNLVNRPEYQVRLNQMRKELDERIIKSRDVMFLPEYELVQLSKTTTPYEFRQSDANYPIKEIYAAASLSGKRSAQVAAQQVKLLNSNNKIVRFWAALGLRSQSAEILKPYKSALQKAMSDSYAPVVITASAVAYEAFGDKSAEDNLKKYITDTNGELQLMTVNYLLYTANKAPFVETIKTALASPHESSGAKWSCRNFLGSLGLIKQTKGKKESDI